MDSQTLAVIAIIVVAVVYLALRGLRRSKAVGRSCDANDCGCGH